MQIDKITQDIVDGKQKTPLDLGQLGLFIDLLVTGYDAPIDGVDRPKNIVIEKIDDIIGLPITNTHPSEGLTVDNYNTFVVGTILKVYDDGKNQIRGIARIMNPLAIDMIKRGVLKDSSPAFYVKQKGNTEVSIDYVDHVALCEEGKWKQFFTDSNLIKQDTIEVTTEEGGMVEDKKQEYMEKEESVMTQNEPSTQEEKKEESTPVMQEDYASKEELGALSEKMDSIAVMLQDMLKEKSLDKEQQKAQEVVSDEPESVEDEEEVVEITVEEQEMKDHLMQQSKDISKARRQVWKSHVEDKMTPLELANRLLKQHQSSSEKHSALPTLLCQSVDELPKAIALVDEIKDSILKQQSDAMLQAKKDEAGLKVFNVRNGNKIEHHNYFESMLERHKNIIKNNH